MTTVKAVGVAEVTDETFEAEVLHETAAPVLVEFTAQWCGPCRQLASVLGAVAAEEADRLKVVQLDVDRNPGTTARYGVLSMPTLMLFRQGEPIAQLVGARPKRRLLAELDEAVTRA